MDGIRHGTILAELENFSESARDDIRTRKTSNDTIESVGALAGNAIASGNIDVISACRWRFAGLRRGLVRSDPGEVALIGGLTSAISSLSAALLASQPRGEVASSAERQTTLKARVLYALADTPMRPSGLADEFGVLQSAVSRALRHLKTEGLVVKTVAPDWAADSRGAWYALRFPEDRSISVQD